MNARDRLIAKIESEKQSARAAMGRLAAAEKAGDKKMAERCRTLVRYSKTTIGTYAKELAEMDSATPHFKTTAQGE